MRAWKDDPCRGASHWGCCARRSATIVLPREKEMNACERGSGATSLHERGGLLPGLWSARADSIQMAADISHHCELIVCCGARETVAAPMLRHTHTHTVSRGPNGLGMRSGARCFRR